MTQETPGPADETAPVGRGPRRHVRKLVIGYFAGGLALLLAGTVAVVYLTVRALQEQPPTDTYASVPRSSRPSGSAGGRPGASPEPSAVAEPSGPLRARFGPRKLRDGQSLVLDGEEDARFQITLKAGKFRAGACNPYSVKPKNGGYLPVKLTLKVLEGEPEVSEFSFRYQTDDGEWLNSVGGSGCDGDDHLGFFRRQSVGRTYTSTVVFDVPRRAGEIVFVYPLLDVAAEWQLK